MVHLLSQIGVAPAKEAQFQKKKIETVEDLLNFFPRKYYDFRQVTPIRQLEEGKVQVVYGEVIECLTGNPSCLRIRDADGYTMQIHFFGNSWIFANTNEGDKMYFGGKVGVWGLSFSMTNPIYASQYPGKIMPIYSKITGMSDKYLKEKIQAALTLLRSSSVFDKKEQRARQMGLMSLVDAYTQFHKPKDGDLFKKARMRIDFERIYAFYEDLYQTMRYAESVPSVSVASATQTDSFIASLPFPLTNGQKNAIGGIRDAALRGQRLNAIVSGDVGCGKTLVAIAASLLMWENGLQSAIMAPTLVLAKQHYQEFEHYLAPLGVKIGLLTSETKKRERTALLKQLASGDIHVLIGTHSILSPDLAFKSLGLTVVDEEHKFGVRQKEMIAEFDKMGAHHINMTATPIPRSYAMSVFGNMVQIMTIPDMPAGRKETITKQIHREETAFEKIYEEIEKGHQAYLVTPFIEESDNEDLKDIASVTVMREKAERYYKKNHPGVRVACISGDMKQAAILDIIDQFAAGQYDLLISTTIVEVGVNIPNATVIAIMNADRFGLAALHQLRGRVGRKGDQGYCLLVSDRQTDRLDALCAYSSGFDIAEQDLRLRGPGDLTGEKQAGTDSLDAIEAILRRPKMANMVREQIVNDL